MYTIKEGNNKFYIGDTQESPLAEICFEYQGEDLVVYHTFVGEALRGQNIARQLLQRMVEFAREKNKKIIPECSFVAAEFHKNSAYEDVWQK